MIPGDVNLYLNGFGDITDNAGRSFFLLVQIAFNLDLNIRGSTGNFGRISPENHFMYETIPAPLIALLCIEADYNYSCGNGPADWNLPKELQPDEIGRKPTSNLLGWRKARKLNEDAMTLLQVSGFVPNKDFYVLNIHNRPINEHIITFVNGRIRGSSIIAFEKMSSSQFGSIAQTPFTASSWMLGTCDWWCLHLSV